MKAKYNINEAPDFQGQLPTAEVGGLKLLD